MKAPDFSGPAAKAWRMEMSARDQKPDWQATVSTILIDAPLASVAWHFWIASVISLRDLPGVPPAKKRFPSATHGLLVAALNPDYPPPDPDHFSENLRFLQPFDHVIQFEVPSDAAASSILDKMVEACCSGIVSPDQYFRRFWRQQVEQLAAHARGEHGRNDGPQ